MLCGMLYGLMLYGINLDNSSLSKILNLIKFYHQMKEIFYRIKPVIYMWFLFDVVMEFHRIHRNIIKRNTSIFLSSDIANIY